MRSNSRHVGQTGPSFIEKARRRQIVDTAIRTIARSGYSRASLAEIAREAGISKGVISYHFRGKGDLVEAVLARLMREPAEFIKQRVDACERAEDKLAAYVRANFEHLRAHRDHYVALVDLWGVRTSTRGGGLPDRFSSEAYGPSRGYLSRILEHGQGRGELRRLPTKTLASVVQASIDGVMLQWVLDPAAVDLDACRDEILQMIRRHVVSDGATRNGQDEGDRR